MGACISQVKATINVFPRIQWEPEAAPDKFFELTDDEIGEKCCNLSLVDGECEADWERRLRDHPRLKTMWHPCLCIAVLYPNLFFALDVKLKSDMKFVKSLLVELKERHTLPVFDHGKLVDHEVLAMGLVELLGEDMDTAIALGRIYIPEKLLNSVDFALAVFDIWPDGYPYLQLFGQDPCGDEDVVMKACIACIQNFDFATADLRNDQWFRTDVIRAHNEANATSPAV
uniref:Uncharacterized protein n=1 Tax=Pinguiococcus pyrenoidosus TaxID=172671 RepID=A0A7R9UGI5_9STRA|mmetsp:Transcript_8244/g.30998  ORF Transcript_8244/g.30998 Transcript_8244/m.30998 type:complete len:229 (+) Transcript_8244:35-721(+)